MPVITIFLYVFFCISGFLQAMQPSAAKPQQVILAHKKRSAEDLFAVIPPSLSLKPLIQINALLEQTDTFSCVYRSLFHAQCLTLALQKAIIGESFEKNLKILLQDEHLLNRTFGYVKGYLDKYDPKHDKAVGVCMHHMLGVCAAHIPVLHRKLLPILLEDDKKIYALHDPTPLLPSPLHYSSDFIHNYGSSTFAFSTCRVELDKSAHLKHQLGQLEGAHRVAHFACRFPKHLFMASIITDQHGYANLYIIDSNNCSLATQPSFLALTSKVLEYTERHNAQFSPHLCKKPRPLTPIPLPIISAGKS